jgi:DNA-binding NtrC family response regulator
MKGRILVVDDDRDMCELLESGLRRRDFQVTFSLAADDARAQLAREEFDVVVTDLNMPGMNGIALCERIAGDRPDVPVVVITAFGSLETAVAAIRAGAYDFITKPFELEALSLTLQRAVQHRRLRQEVTRLRRAVSDSQHLGEIVGASAVMKHVFDLVDRVAETDASVLITGESGTGKELVAHALHERSKRKAGPFVSIHCSAMPESLLENELFGRAKAELASDGDARDGLFVQANQGSLFLDEIGEVPLGLQLKLLRALQEHSIRPLGSDSQINFDARIIAATNRDLETATEEKRFREDLFYRIHVVRIELPPLRARGSDVLLLAQHFITRFAGQFDKQVVGLSAAAADKLMAYAWPGNVRELQNAIEHAVALTRFEQLVVEDLPEKIRDYRSSHLVIASDDPSELLPIEEVERRYILRALEALGGNRTLTARTLGLDRKTLYRKLQRYGVSNDGKKDEV